MLSRCNSYWSIVDTVGVSGSNSIHVSGGEYELAEIGRKKEKLPSVIYIFFREVTSEDKP